jgi:phosphoribosylglycinamide formyltransferase-1
MKRIVVLISGSGSNLEAIIEACLSQRINGEVVHVISNVPDVFGLTRAANHRIPSSVINHNDFINRESFDKELYNRVSDLNPDLVVLAGFMRILSANFTNPLKGKLVNIHPSLLPKYPGLNTHQQAIDNQDSHHGISIHFVTEELDGGPIIAQGSMKLDLQSSLEKVIDKIHRIEHNLYPKVVAELLDIKVCLKDNKVQFSHESEFKDAQPLQFN